jgi:Bifunctional DNA primase/polymerase, N-terminal
VTLAQAALAYAALDISVIPLHTPTGGGCSCWKGAACLSPGKHTRVAWKEYQQRPATLDEIRHWWGAWPDANVGIITGVISRLGVLDVDPRNGGLWTLAELDARGGRMPDDNPLVETGSLGLHHYFQLDAPLPKAAPFQGIEVQADGALVVAPPSLHHSGRRYRWLRPLDSPRPLVPAWLRWAVETVSAPPAAPVVPLQDASSDDVLAALLEAGLYLRAHRRRGLHRIRCPWSSEHSKPDAEAVVLEPGASPAPGWAFKCMHAHCSERHIGELLDALGIARRRAS